VAALPWLIAHGGIYGAFAEAAVALGVGGLFVWIWLRERRRAQLEGGRAIAEMRGDDDRNTR